MKRRHKHLVHPEMLSVPAFLYGNLLELSSSFPLMPALCSLVCHSPHHSLFPYTQPTSFIYLIHLHHLGPLQAFECVASTLHGF